MIGHRFSGWPGAYCLDCGAEDPYEIALANGEISFEEVPGSDEPRFVISEEMKEHIEQRMICSDPGSNITIIPISKGEWLIIKKREDECE